MRFVVNRLRHGASFGSVRVVAFAVFVLAPVAALADDARVLMLGDSLTAGYGLAAEDTVPVRLEGALGARGFDVAVENAGVSGDTTAGGLARLDWLLGGAAPEVLVIELGGNDGLRAIDPAATRANLEATIEKGLEAGSVVVLAGMLAPPNLGRDYEQAFNAVFADLAETHPVIFYPFFLDGVAGEAAFNQDDGIHPNAAGAKIIVERFAPAVVEALERANVKPNPGKGDGR